MRQFIRWLVIVALLGAAGWGLQKWRSKTLSADESPEVQRPTTAAVDYRDIHFVVNAAGDIGPADQVSVRPEVNGKIAELPVDIGDHVKKGDLLFRLDDQNLQIEKQSQLKEIERAKLQLDQAQRNYQRSDKLFQDRLISRELFEDAKTQYDLAKNTLEQAQKALDLIDDRLRKTQILAPFDCTVLTRPVSVGQAVSGSGGFNSGTEVLTIANLKDLVINAHINQADVTRLKLGEHVLVSVEAVPGLQVGGMIERIAPQATIRNNLKGFDTRILLKNVDKRVRPGMTANIKIPVASADHVLAVPMAAVFTDSDATVEKPNRYVYVKKENGFERRPVEIGISDYFYAEVRRGLTAGEVVSLERPKNVETTTAEHSGGQQASSLTP